MLSSIRVDLCGDVIVWQRIDCRSKAAAFGHLNTGVCPTLMIAFGEAVHRGSNHSVQSHLRVFTLVL